MIPNLPHLWFEPHPECPSLRQPSSDEGMTAMDRLVLAPRRGAQSPVDAASAREPVWGSGSADLEPTGRADGSTGHSGGAA